MINQQQGNPNLIIFSLWLLVFAASSQIMIISPILPRISEQLQTPEALLGSLVTAYAAMVGLFPARFPIKWVAGKFLSSAAWPWPLPFYCTGL